MKIPILLSLASCALIISSANAAVITHFQQNFTGGSTSDLNGTAPDTTEGGANWVATSGILQNGVINPSAAGTATLAFTPTVGRVYTLEASFTGITAASGSNDWIALAFAEGQSTSSDASGVNTNRFIVEDTIGKAWMFARGATTPNPNGSFLGDASSGNADVADWTGGPAVGTSNVDMRIVLDTTGSNWTATWFAKEGSSGSYTQVRSTANLLNETITSVGFGRANSSVDGTISSFSLTSVPEPSSAALLGMLGILCLLRRRR